MKLQINKTKRLIAMIAMMLFFSNVFAQVPIDLQLSNVHISGNHLNFTLKFRGGAGYSTCGYSLGGFNVYLDAVYPNDQPALHFKQISGVYGIVPDKDPIFNISSHTIMTGVTGKWRIGLTSVKNIVPPSADIDEDNYFIIGTYSVEIESGDPVGAVLKVVLVDPRIPSVWHGNHIASGAREQPLLRQPFVPTRPNGFPIQAAACPAEALWTGALDTDWHDADNWVNPANGNPTGIPCATTNVYIPGSGYRGDALGAVVPIHLPTLSTDANCNEITFFQGGQLGRIDLLTYNKARVQLNFPGGNQGARYYNSSSTDPTAYYKFAKAYSSPELTAGAWHMLSIPLQGVVSGDLGYGGYPMTFMRKFNVENDAQMDNYISGDWSESYRTTTEKLNPAEGFAFYMYPQGTSFGTVYSANDNKNITGSTTNYGIGATSGIIEFPTYDNTYKLNSHRIQTYSSGSSIFYDVEVGGYVFPLGDILVGGSTPVARTNNDYKLNTAYFSTDGFAALNREVLVGNPFMAALDFTAFHGQNSGTSTPRITNAYRIWNGTSFIDYNCAGETATSGAFTTYIPPMQSFFVTGTRNGSFTFDPEDMSVIVPKAAPVYLRSTQEKVERNIIRLSATNQQATTTNAIIAQSEGAGIEYKEGEDITKLFSPYKSVSIDNQGNEVIYYSPTPEIYTLAGEIALSMNYIGQSGAIVPIGIRVAPSGSTTLRLTGMNNYNAEKIELVDGKTEITIADITNLPEYEYSFNNEEAGYQSGRFYLRIAESTTGTENIDLQGIQVYKANEAIQVLSSPDNRIKQIRIYDMQGRILYNNASLATDIYSVKEQFDKQQVVIVQVVTEKNTESVKIKN